MSHGYFEQFVVGQQWISAEHHVTAAEIAQFAALSGDFHPLHTDPAYAAQTRFGRIVAHGLLVQSLATGMATQLGVLTEKIVALRAMTAKWIAPVFIDDHIRVELTVIETEGKRGLGVGNVTLQFRVIKDVETVVHTGTWIVLVQSERPPTSADAN